MNINISDNLKRLRKQRELTQEDLANFIGVSFQAVSKWECGDGYPDITILPALANFFDVTIDELVGMNEIKNQAKLDDIIARYKKLIFDGKQKEGIELLREALKIFPNNYQLLADLAFALFVSNSDEEKKKNGEEAVKISECILEFCTDTEIRNRVQAEMCLNLHNAGQHKKAAELAKKLPSLNDTREKTLTIILTGEEKKKASQEVIQWLTHELYAQMRWHLYGADYTDTEKLKIYQKSIDIYNIIHEEKDFIFGHVHLYDLYQAIAQIYIKLNSTDEALVNLEKSAEHAIAYATLTDEEHEGKSLLTNAIKFEGKGSTGTDKNSAHLLLDLLKADDYKSIADNARFQIILADLEKYAN